MAGDESASGMSSEGRPADGDAPAATLRAGRLSFDGHATLGDFEGSTRDVTGAVRDVRDYAPARGWVEAPVASLRTGNALRDRDLRKVMEVARYPTMRYDLEGATLGPARSDDVEQARVVLHGTLTLHGVARSVDVPVTIRRAGDTARVEGTFPVDVTDHDVRGLDKLGGLLRMHPRIEVRLALEFVRTR